jgi:YggT family protein
MSDLIRYILSIASGLLILYSLLIFIRILLGWFSGIDFGIFYMYLRRITDPYLLWFRRFKLFRAGAIDLSPILALAVLTIANNILMTVAATGKISLGIVLALLLSAVWSAASFIIIFFIVIIALRLIAYLMSANVYSPFWLIIDSISRPVIFTFNRILFRHKIINYLSSIIVTIAFLVILFCVLAVFVYKIGVPVLAALPV